MVQSSTFNIPVGMELIMELVMELIMELPFWAYSGHIWMYDI